MQRASASAPGKLILLGEHAVVYGMPALAIPVAERRSHAEVEPNFSGVIHIEDSDSGDSWPPDGLGPSPLSPLADLSLAALRRFGRVNLGLSARLRSTIPISSGMGSSASISVALARAVALAIGVPVDISVIVDIAMVGERGYHGTPSGTDVEVAAREEPIIHIKGSPVRPVKRIGGDFHFIAANTGRRSVGTADIVREVAEAYGQNADKYGRIFSEMGDLALKGAEILEGGTSIELGAIMNRAQALLAAIGVSSPAIEAIIDSAMKAGAAGAKLSGAGRGGHVVIALRSPDDIDRVCNAAKTAGAIDICALKLAGSKSEERG